MMFNIKIEILDHIKQSLSFPEMGGILGINVNDRHTVTDFYYDNTGITRKSSYTPDVEALNKVISEWAEHGIEFIGFVHSHPGNNYQLSKPDIEYANKIMESCDMSEILMVIYLPDNEKIYQYTLNKNWGEN